MTRPAGPVRISRELAREVDRLSFGAPVSHVYNPLLYARRGHEMYLRRFARPGIEALWLGMNPGPWGMAQTGVPFGEVSYVRDWLGIVAPVERPASEHPRRPVLGMACARSEVSGRRLWGWARKRFETPERFFARFGVWNYCPLMFLEASGRNRTPDRLPASERDPLFERCDRALDRIVRSLRPALVIGMGAFAEKRARIALAKREVRIARILHPSPASPAANRGWARQAEAELQRLGVELPGPTLRDGRSGQAAAPATGSATGEAAGSRSARASRADPAPRSRSRRPAPRRRR